METIDTTPYTVTTRKGGCEIWVSNETWNLFIGELTNELRYPDQTTDVDNKTIADVMRKAQVICNALNENQMEQM